MDIKLQELIKEFALEQEKPKVNKYEVTEAIRNYARIGEQLRVNNNIIETAKQLARMAEDAQNHPVPERCTVVQKHQASQTRARPARAPPQQLCDPAREAQQRHQALHLVSC